MDLGFCFDDTDTLIDITELFFFLIPFTLLSVENISGRQQLSCFPLGCTKVIPKYPVLVKMFVVCLC